MIETRNREGRIQETARPLRRSGVVLPSMGRSVKKKGPELDDFNSEMRVRHTEPALRLDPSGREKVSGPNVMKLSRILLAQ